MPLIDIPETIQLRGACGPGFGRGQMLGRMHLTDRTAPIVVERAFLPESIRKNFTTHPLAWQTRPFMPDRNCLNKWTYVIIDVAVDSVTDPVYTVENLDGSPVQASWSKLDLSRFRFDDAVGVQLSIITGLSYRNRNYRPARGQILRNFADADRIDTSGWRPSFRRERPAATNVDPGRNAPVSKQHKAAVAIKATGAPAPAPASKPGPDVRQHQQHKHGGKPTRIRGPLNNAFRAVLGDLKLK